MSRGPRRLVVTGCPGSGKTRLAATLSRTIGVPHIELDALYHGPDWTPAEPAAFASAVAALADGPAWVIDGNYRAVREIVRARADLVVALDLARPVVFARLVRRTLTRMISGAELWNGNREDWRTLFTADPQVNLLLWAHQNFGKYRARARADELAGRTGGPAAVRLTSPAQVARFTRYLAAADTGRRQTPNGTSRDRQARLARLSARFRRAPV